MEDFSLINSTDIARERLFLAIDAAIKAGDAIMEIYLKDFSVILKKDLSPLTLADEVSDQIIRNILAESSLPIISEESKAQPYDERRHWDTVWLIDPLDGTKEFIKKNDEFTVNIALVRSGLPVIGVVYLPATKQLYFAMENLGSFLVDLNDFSNSFTPGNLIDTEHRLKINEDLENFTIVASRSHMSHETESFIEKCKKLYGKVNLVSKGSSIKICLVAEGRANVYPRLAPTMEWDTAAAHAVAKFAGCKVINPNTNAELTYNKEDLLNTHFVVTR